MKGHVFLNCYLHVNLGDHCFKLCLISPMCTCMFWKTYACTFWDFLGGSDGKEFTCIVGDPGLIPGSGRASGEGNGNPLQYSYLWNSMDTGAIHTHIHRYRHPGGILACNTYMRSFPTASFCFFNAVSLKSTHGMVYLIKILTIKHILLRFISCLFLEKTWCNVFS